MNAISPGFIVTPRMTEVAAESGTYADTLARRIVADLDVPLGRPGRPEEAAQLILLLVSPAVSYLNGSECAVDGGLLPTV